MLIAMAMCADAITQWTKYFSAFIVSCVLREAVETTHPQQCSPCIALTLSNCLSECGLTLSTETGLTAVLWDWW